MDDIFDELLGEPEDEDFDLNEYARGGHKASRTMSIGSARKVQRGVTEGWLSEVFRVPRTTVRRKIEANNIVPNEVIGPNKTKFYDIRDVAPHLVKLPNIEQHLAKMSYKDLPHQLTKAYWAGRREQLKVQEEEGDLWRSTDVISLFGDLFRMTKNQTRQWQSKIEKAEKMSNPQVEELRNLSDELLASFYRIYESLERGQSTPSLLAAEDEYDEEE